jgi:hypothetical protein
LKDGKVIGSTPIFSSVERSPVERQEGKEKVTLGQRDIDQEVVDGFY